MTKFNLLYESERRREREEGGTHILLNIREKERRKENI